MTPSVAATLTLDRTSAGLSDSVRATVSFEGPAPLVVAAPKDPLAGAAAEAWRVRPAGPAAVEKLPDGRERWAQVYRLDPYVPGDAVPVAFAPFEVAAGGGPGERVEVRPQTVTVRTGLKDPKPADARPVTGVEDPPAGPVDTGGWAIVPAVSVAAVLLLAVATVLVRRKRPLPPPTPGEWVGREFTAIEQELMASRLAPAEFADRLATAVRGFVERQYGVPATRRTTGELAAAEPLRPGGVVPVDAVRPLLERCDLAKFAGRPPTPEECQELLAKARVAVATGD
jgi:hypothetical protein